MLGLAMLLYASCIYIFIWVIAVSTGIYVCKSIHLAIFEKIRRQPSKIHSHLLVTSYVENDSEEEEDSSSDDDDDDDDGVYDTDTKTEPYVETNETPEALDAVIPCGREIFPVALRPCAYKCEDM